MKLLSHTCYKPATAWPWRLLVGFQILYKPNALNLRHKTKKPRVSCVWSDWGALFSMLFNLERGKHIMGQFILFYNLRLSREKKCLQGPSLHAAASLGDCNMQDTEAKTFHCSNKKFPSEMSTWAGLSMALGFNFSLCVIQRLLV